MRIKTLDFASGRTKDGRQFAAGEGVILDADDTDQDKVDLFRSFVDAGVARLVEPEPEPEPPAKTESDPAKTEPKARKATTAGKAKDGAE